MFATSASDHGLCSIGLYTHNLGMTSDAASEPGAALKVFNDLTYVRMEDVQTPLDPDVVLLFVRPSQTLIVAEASRQLEGNLPPAMGRPACAVLAQAKNSGRSALSPGCCGARAYLDVLSDNVALYAIPGQSIAAFAERVTALAKANAILTKFHEIRRRDVEAGKNPTIHESLPALQSAG